MLACWLCAVGLRLEIRVSLRCGWGVCLPSLGGRALPGGSGAGGALPGAHLEVSTSPGTRRVSSPSSLTPCPQACGFGFSLSAAYLASLPACPSLQPPQFPITVPRQAHGPHGARQWAQMSIGGQDSIVSVTQDKSPATLHPFEQRRWSQLPFTNQFIEW